MAKKVVSDHEKPVDCSEETGGGIKVDANVEKVILKEFL